MQVSVTFFNKSVEKGFVLATITCKTCSSFFLFLTVLNSAALFLVRYFYILIGKDTAVCVPTSVQHGFGKFFKAQL